MEGTGTAYSGPVRIRLSSDLHTLGLDESEFDEDAARLMPGWALARADRIEGDWQELQEAAGRWAGGGLPRLVRLPSPDYANPLHDQAHIYTSGPADDANRPDPAGIYEMGAIPDRVAGFRIAGIPPMRGADAEELMDSPDGRFNCYWPLTGRHGLCVQDHLRQIWFAVDGPGLPDEVPGWTAAWAGHTLVFDLVDVGFSEPRPKVMSKTHVEVDLAARKVTRVVPFGPYTGNWPF